MEDLNALRADVVRLLRLVEDLRPELTDATPGRVAMIHQARKHVHKARQALDTLTNT